MSTTISPLPQAIGVLPRAEPIPNVNMVSNLTLMAILSRPLVSPDCSPREPVSDDDGSNASHMITSRCIVSAAPVSPTLAPCAEDEQEDRASMSSTSSDAEAAPLPLAPPKSLSRRGSTSTGLGGMRLNKFVRRLYDMLMAEKDSGIVEWRRGLLVLHSTDAFSKQILKKYFNTSSYKTFRRQLNYYGFVHVRSFSTTGSSTTALWVNQDLARLGNASIASVLTLKRVEPCDSAKTAEARRARKELAVSTVEDDLGVSAKTLQIEQIRSLALRGETTVTAENQVNAAVAAGCNSENCGPLPAPIPLVVHCSHDDRPTAIDERQSCSSVASVEDEENSAAANLLLMLSKASKSHSLQELMVE